MLSAHEAFQLFEQLEPASKAAAIVALRSYANKDASKESSASGEAKRFQKPRPA